jgi:uncharacterized protein YbjT (DUF2867 family)
MAEQIITVLGGTGTQGGGVIDALIEDGRFRLRAPVRNPTSDAALSLGRRGVELIKADVLDIDSMHPVFKGAYGAFVVTNFWDPAQMHRETAVGTQLAKAACAAGVHHLIWSTLPDCESISRGRYKVAHFTDKSRVDAVVQDAGFPRHTFVRAPMYFQNFIRMNRPVPLPSGARGWAVPMDPAARVMHAGDATEVGRAVAAAFVAGDRLRNGSYLDVCAGTYSWNDFVGALKALGHHLGVERVPVEVYDTFFEGAPELREMYQYYEEYTYFGPEHETRIAATAALVPGGFTSFPDWAKVHMKAT